MTDDLEERFWKFKALELPGQPKIAHMGSMQLVDDLWREILKLREERDQALTDRRRHFLRAADLHEKAVRLETAINVVVSTFEKDQAEGFRSRDRTFAIDILRMALKEGPT